MAKVEQPGDAGWIRACEALLSPDERASEWLLAADIIQGKLGGIRGEQYGAFLRSRLAPLKSVDAALLNAIAKCAAAGNRIATTNYDHLLSHHLRRDRVDWTQPAYHAVEALRDTLPAVWHIHGDYGHPDSVIFSKSDYDRVKAHDFAQFVQKLATLQLTFVFVGCSGDGLADNNVGALLTWLREGFAGLGDKHFVLVADSNTDKWPAGVTPVRFGGFGDLPAYLAKLAPESASRLPPNPRMIGREDRLKELVKAILDYDRPIVVPGALGMGKTTLALAAAHDPRIIERFGKERRFFVNLEPAPDAEGVLGRLATQLGLPATGAAHELEAKIVAACAAEPTLAILDNLETPWRNDIAATEALLGRLAAIEGLKLVITVGGEPPGIGARTLRNVEQLQDADARALFLRHAGDHFGSDLALLGILKGLDGHPLSIELLAANAQGKADLKGLAADWNDRRADLLRRGAANDRKTSLRASLDLSLAALNPPSPAHCLVRLMALLPDGMSEADSHKVLSDGEPTREERGAGARHETARLASRATGRWRLLAPIRETLLADLAPEAKDRVRLVNVFLRRAALGEHAGADKWNDVREELVAEAGNLDAMIGVAAKEPELPDGLSSAVAGLRELHRLTGLASYASLPAVANRFHDAGNLLGEANCILSLGEIALARSDHDGARQRYEAALPLYQEVGSVLGEANCVRSLGDIAYERSDYDDARQRNEAALPLYQKVGDVLGEANCILSLGEIAFARPDSEGARHLYEVALPLYQKVGSVPGEANCIKGLGDIALARSDYEGARQRYEAALPLFQRVGNVRGEASCIGSLGHIALGRGDYDGARQRYDAALPLFQKVGSLLGEARCIHSLGEIDEAKGEVAAACRREALALYARIPEPRSIGTVHLRLARGAATPTEAAEHREAARKAWESIGRPDLIERFLGKDG